MISVVLATHNEESNLKRCLNSVRSLADEIIVVDGESTDGTIKLAEKLGAKVFSTTNKANFHINKQIAMDKARGELVLQLDADEVVDEELSKFILEIHQKITPYSDSDRQAELPSAWWIKRKNWFMGVFLQKGGQYPDPVIRLYRNGKARLPQKDVHEQMVVDGEIGWAEGHLLHYGNPTLGDYIRKWNTYTSFKATQLHEDGESITLLNTVRFLGWKPLVSFASLFIRHKGFVDGFPGFVFAVCSGLHHSMAYLKLWELKKLKK